MLETAIVIVSGIGGAHLMTLFLRLINTFVPHGIRVPLILAQVVHHYFNDAPLYHLRHKNTYGHAVHLLVGVFFAFCYSWLWRHNIFGFTALDIILLGLVNGMVGMAGWFVFLRLTYEPEQIREKIFFPIILIAHIVFALGLTATYVGLCSLT